MDDKALLEAIGQMMAAQEQRFSERMEEQKKELSDMMDAKLAKQKKEILEEATQRMKVLLDTEVATKFNLLAEGQEDILRRMPSEEDMDIIDGRLDTLEAIVKKHAKDIAALKKAN